MLRTLGVVQVGGDPVQFAKLRRRLGGRTLLSWIIRRMTDCQQLDRVVVLAHSPSDEASLRALVPQDVPLVFSSAGDALTRFVQLVAKYPAKAVVRVRGDNPFIEPGMIDRLVTTADAHPECDYISYCGRDGRPTILSPMGLFAEWFRADALVKAGKSKSPVADREQIAPCLLAHPETFVIRLIPTPAVLDRDDVRLSVESEEDWDNAVMLFEAIGPERWDWQRIAELLEQQPALRNRMAALNRAGAPQ